MKSHVILVFVFFKLVASAQSTFQNSSTFIDKLQTGDSILYYQCHIESAQQELQTASGQTLQSHPKQLSITEKFVLIKKENSYTLQHYVSSFTTCPNRRFSGLKFSEKPYWEFAFKNSKDIHENAIKSLRTLENSGKEANEYNLAITAQNNNQIIILFGKKEKQLGIKEGVFISKLLNP